MNNWIELKENNKYEINECGIVRNKKTKKSLKYWKTTIGYNTVCLFKNGIRKTYYVHRLIANNFIENPKKYNEVNHIDGNKENNSISNLEWCTHQHNMREAHNNGLIRETYGKDNPISKKVKQTIIKTGEIIIWDSMMDAQREMGYSTGSICDACKGNLKTAYKSKWEYV